MPLYERSPRPSFVLTVAASIAVVLATMTMATPAQASDPPCGPVVGGVHQVSTAAQLQAVGSGGTCPLSGSYLQVADIVLPPPVAPHVSNWIPIGTGGARFTGTFDGGHHTITGVRIESNSDFVGLFGYIDALAPPNPPAIVRNTHLLDVNVLGRNYVGALVGRVNDGSRISNSSSTGVVSGRLAVGGLVGTMGGGSTTPRVMETSMSSAAVSGTSAEVGGLVGDVQSRVNISRSYATGNVSGPREVGALTGWCCATNSGFTTDSFARGSATATALGAGGIVGGGGNSASRTYTRVYATGAVNAPFAGGLLGVQNTPYGEWIDSFWDTTTTQATSGAGNGVTPTGAIGLDTAGMTSLATFDDSGWSIAAGVDLTKTWGIDPAINNGYPFLTWSVRLLAYDANGGTGVPSGAQALVWESVIAAGSVGVERSGFTFTSWNTRADGSGISYAPGDLVMLPWHSRDGVSTVTTLYAQWAAPAPAPPTPSSPPGQVSAVAGDQSADVSWLPPASTGSFPVTNYLVRSSPGGHTCLTSTTSCTVSGLANDTAYTFSVQALTGAGWSVASVPSNVVVPGDAASIMITGSRTGRVITVSGETPELGMGAIVRPWVRLAGQSSFAEGSARILVSDDGTFEWSRRAARGVEVFVATTDGETRSNTVRLPRR